MVKVQCDGCGRCWDAVINVHGARHLGCAGHWRLVDEQPAKPPLTVQEAEARLVELEVVAIARKARERQCKTYPMLQARGKDLAAQSATPTTAATTADTTDKPAMSGQEKPALPLPWCKTCNCGGHEAKYCGLFDKPCAVINCALGRNHDGEHSAQRAPHPAEPRWPVEALARAIFDDWLTEEAACIADPVDPVVPSECGITIRVSSRAAIDRVLDVMWAKTKPAERREAEAMATRLVERMGNR